MNQRIPLALPEVWDEETLPLGLYRLPGKPEWRDEYDINVNQIVHAEMEMVIGIAPPGKLPIGTLQAYVRKDGCRVIKAWMAVEK